MKNTSGRRVRRREGRRGVRYTAIFGVFSAIALLCLGGADKLLGTISAFVDDDFFAAALALELHAHDGLGFNQAVLSQSFLLTVGTSEKHDEKQDQHTFPTFIRTIETTQPSSTTDGAASGPSATSTVDLDPSVKTITVAAVSDDGYDVYDGVYISNKTKYEVDVQSYLEADVAELFSGDAEVLIVQSHASEAFYPDGDDVYIPTDVDRTEDTRYNVVHLGDIMRDELESFGVKVTHICEIFDYPTYNGSYTRTLAAIEKELENNPNIKIVIDVHRDAMITADDIKYRTITDIDGQKAAQLMFVMGTNEGGLPHPKWRTNLTLAVHLQKRLADRYPTLCRPINLSRSRYNQHMTDGSMIIEVGTSGNTLQEARVSAEIFARELGALLSELRDY